MKKGLFILLLLSMIFIAGCTNLFAGNKPVAGKGVSIRFLPNAPPVGEIDEGHAVPVTAELFNNGLNPVNGELCVSDGLSPLYIGIENARDCQTFNLAGGSIREGEDEFVNRAETFSFPALGEFYTYKVVSGEKVDTVIKAEVTYNYITSTSPQICISGNDRDCRLDEVISGSSLGNDALRSPVTVTKIEKSLAPAFTTAGLSLKIYIQNVGGGKVIDNSGENREKVDISINPLGWNAEIRCSPTSNGVITLENGAKVISCSANVPVEEGFTNNQLEIELRYTYKIEEKRAITIKKVV